ncbi:unnamed protein product [Notodromas monacha]|uniref:PBZ-type domain-containing protein n=1 Tax=Notodromas monacha TaxID=399045 RepID=A0A7R9BQQ5_9CRUS|nr:unnamed protein product [Notodromas monacha]CAG0918433.1 unnamed protein product [Notodromas monacha]
MRALMKRIDASGDSIEIPFGVTILGRGHLLNCMDKSISRHHAEITFIPDEGSVILKSTHSKPCFVWKASAETPESIVAPEEVRLDNEFRFAFHPNSFIYAVTIIDDGLSEASNAPLTPHLEEEVPALKCKDMNEAGPSVSDPEVSAIRNDLNRALDPSLPAKLVERKRRLPSWLSDSKGLESTAKKPRKLPLKPNDGERRKRIRKTEESRVHVSESEKAGSAAPESQNEPPVDVPFDSSHAPDEESDEKSSEASTIPFASPRPVSPESENKVESSQRRSCAFGSTCYRRNPAHRAELAHPGDPDYVEPKEDENDIGRNATAKRRIDYEEESDEDEYDMDDPFMASDSEVEYSPTDEEDDDDDIEEEEEGEENTQELKEEAKKDRTRMLKEAQRFLKRDKK